MRDERSEALRGAQDGRNDLVHARELASSHGVAMPVALGDKPSHTTETQASGCVLASYQQMPPPHRPLALPPHRRLPRFWRYRLTAGCRASAASAASRGPSGAPPPTANFRRHPHSTPRHPPAISPPSPPCGLLLSQRDSRAKPGVRSWPWPPTAAPGPRTPPSPPTEPANPSPPPRRRLRGRLDHLRGPPVACWMRASTARPQASGASAM